MSESGRAGSCDACGLGKRQKLRLQMLGQPRYEVYLNKAEYEFSECDIALKHTYLYEDTQMQLWQQRIHLPQLPVLLALLLLPPSCPRRKDPADS